MITIATHPGLESLARRTPQPASTSRRRRGFRSRRSAKPSRPPPPFRPPARIAGWARRISRSRWAASRPRSRPTAARRPRMSSSSSRRAAATDLLAGLDPLAEVCDAGTRVIVIGRHNDVLLYRELVRRGISDYLISPLGTLDVVRAICGCSPHPMPSRSAASSRWSAPRAASAPRPSRTTSPGRWRAISRSIRS